MDIGILPEFRTTAMRLGAKSWRCAARLAMCEVSANGRR
jgi:hypothetical protein